MDRRVSLLLSLVLACLLALAAGCAAAPAPPADPTPAAPPAPAVAPPQPSAAPPAPAAVSPWPAPRPIALPADDAPHAALTEWWYYHGHLESAGGGEYGFQLVVFKRQVPGGRAGYVAHAAVTDPARSVFQYQQELSLPPPAAPRAPGFDLKVGAQQARGYGGADELSGRTTDYAFDLRLEPLKPAVLHGVTGYIGVSPGEFSYYYSRSRMAVSGTLNAAGAAVAVNGRAWMDHQWGDFSLEGPGGWDWAGVQLSDGSDLMVSVLRDGTGRPVLAYGTLVTPLGGARHLPAGAMQLRATGRWTSPATEITYPMGWELEVPGEGFRLALAPVLAQQELDTRDTTGRVYWEGQVRVQGHGPTGALTGRGYVEMTGYAPVAGNAAQR